VRAAALRSGRAWIEFRTMPQSEVETIRKQLGDKWSCKIHRPTGIFGIAVNQTIKPFNDERVRKALTLGLDRYTASRVLYPHREPQGRRRADASCDGVGDVGRRASKVSGLREGHGEESRRGKRLWPRQVTLTDSKRF